MAQLKVILTDDEGNEVSYHEYLLGSELANLSRIENSVEQLRPALLSALTHDLLAHEQSQYKKTEFRSKGSYPVTIKTLNGSFAFAVHRFETPEGCQNWFRLTDEKLHEHHESPLLQEFAVRYATRLSYAKTSELVAERSGTSSLSDQRIYHLVAAKAGEVVAGQKQIIRASEEHQVAVKAVAVDLYEAQAKEVVWLADGVCVNEQKAVRDKQAKEGKERTTTEIAMLEKKDGSYQTIIAGPGVSRERLYQAEIVREYGAQAARLPVVVVTDGARSLKKEAQKVFGAEVRHILDWYHLEAKVYQLMTQIAPGKQVKEEYNKLIINELWKGESGRAISCLEEIAARNEKKRDELKGYLEKNESYIINYEKRSEAGKIIGSGRMEKQNDVVVAQRQKRKGMSWSKNGSWNLAIVTAHFNHGTNYLQ